MKHFLLTLGLISICIGSPARLAADSAGGHLATAKGHPTAPVAPPTLKLFYWECSAKGVGIDGKPVDFGKFVIDISDSAFWMSSPGFRVAENARALNGYMTLQAHFKDLKSSTGIMQVKFAQQKFMPPTSWDPGELVTQNLDVGIGKPFEAALSGKGALRSATVKCDPLGTKIGADRKAYDMAIMELDEAKFFAKNPNGLLPARTPAQIASRIKGNLSVAHEMLADITDDAERAQIEKLIKETQALPMTN